MPLPLELRGTKLAPHITGRRVPLRVHVLAICAAADGPVTTDQIIRRLQEAGVATNAKSSRRYLHSVLRQHERLREIAPYSCTATH